MICEKYRDDLAELLFDREAFVRTPAGERAELHVASCADCRNELESLRSTIDLLDAWKAPEVSPFFDTRMSQLLREEAAAPPAGFWERMRARWQMNPAGVLKPAMAGALAVMVAVGGATYAGVSYFAPQPSTQASATVRDLQSLDGNAQAIDTLSALDQDSSDSDNGSQTQ